MRRAPSCLLFTAFLLSLGGFASEAALAESGFRSGAVAHRGVAHTSARGRWTAPRHGALRHPGRWQHATPRHSRPFPYPGFRRFHTHRGFHHHHRGGYGGFGFSPYRVWSYVDASDDVVVPLGIDADAPPPPVFPAIPSVADLPASTGIRSAPVAAPAIYVLGSGKRTVGTRGPKIVDTDEGEREDLSSGPRIIHLDVPRGR